MPPSKPIFDVPPGAAAKVSIIDSTLRLSNLAVDYLMGPPLDGFDVMHALPTWSFLVESPAGRKVLFDLGVPKDLGVYAPAVLKDIEHYGWDVSVDRDVAEILGESGIHPGDISSVIWSHFHFDHIGDISKFPSSTELVVGPGFKQKFSRAYPTDPDSVLRESYWENRTLREISYDSSDPQVSRIGAFRAYDFFGDGSFYLLDTPGHAVGHVAGLARTTTGEDRDTFIFMGGDLCHHGGEMRPTAHDPIPDDVRFPLPDALRARFSVCPGGAQFRQLNTKRGRKEDEPFFETQLAADLGQALDTIQKTQTADVQDNVFFIFAHDTSIGGVVNLFPEPANEWRAKGWREEVHWGFLKDLCPGLVP
ncbi:beta-lactamase-like protein [Pestalotiopsis sp. NC0098]|nr:beta-lactamase-like protein [Pestalotiopsis sp. NC0098]